MNTKNNDGLRLVINNEIGLDRLAADIQLRTALKRSTRDALNFLGTVIRNNAGPLADRRHRNLKRAGNIGSRLEMGEDILFEHDRNLTQVDSALQPQFIERVLTLVEMNDLQTLAGRIQDALDATQENASWLAAKSGVSPAAVGKWLSGETKMLKSEVLYAAAKALRVNPDWLRTGKGARQPGKAAQDEGKIEDAVRLLSELHGPLLALVGAIERLGITEDSVKKPKRT